MYYMSYLGSPGFGGGILQIINEINTFIDKWLLDWLR